MLCNYTHYTRELQCAGAAGDAAAADATSALTTLHLWGLDAALDQALVQLACRLGLCQPGATPPAGMLFWLSPSRACGNFAHTLCSMLCCAV